MSPQERLPRQGLCDVQLPGPTFFVTCRLAGSVPPAAVERLRRGQQRWLRRFAERGADPTERLPSARKLLFGRLDDLLDQAAARDRAARGDFPEFARTLLRRHDGRAYRLLAYCVMPNHLHALLRPRVAAAVGEAPLGEQADDAGPLARVMRAWKGAANGPAWHPESYVQEVRDAEELQRFVDYIAYNPVKAGLARRVHEWPWCSAHDRFRADGRETAWLVEADASSKRR